MSELTYDFETWMWDQIRYTIIGIAVVFVILLQLRTLAALDPDAVTEIRALSGIVATLVVAFVFYPTMRFASATFDVAIDRWYHGGESE